MRMLINVRYIVSIGTLILILVEECLFAGIPTYRDICNETVSLETPNGAGILEYIYYPQQNRQRCKIVIEAEPGHYVGYTFRETSAFRTISVQNDYVFYSCTSVVWYEDGTERSYGCINSNYTDKLQTTYSNSLTVEVQGDEFTNFNFELVFFSFHYGACNRYEVPCDLLLAHVEDHTTACIDSSLAYDTTFNICDSLTSEGSDIIGRDYNGSFIAAIVLLCVIIIPLLILTCYLILRKYCKKPEPEPEDIPTRARRLFAAIIAEAHENECYETGPIDPSKFDPPPEYGSLEQLGGAGVDGSIGYNDKRLSQISIECPPAYSDVMKHSNEYLVSSHI